MSRDYSQFLPNKYYPLELESLAIEACKKAANESGERANNAKCELAWRMKNGLRGIAKDEKAARALYEEVIKSDRFHQRAHYELGVMQEMGRGGPEDRVAARSSYEKLEVGALVMVNRLNAIAPTDFKKVLDALSYYYPAGLEGVLVFLKKQTEKGDIDAPYLLAHFANLLNQINSPWNNLEATMTVPHLTRAAMRGMLARSMILRFVLSMGTKHLKMKSSQLTIWNRQLSKGILKH
jgi:TPR repeat protein